ncbi:hypothetical protein, partial [Raoultella ornithinolytica]|uniref:hypothetical protein n=1 Tax=Raoultella ornithinolytica TaxID=54291 RepID=UPI0023505B6C
ARGSHLSEMIGIFIVLSGFATTDLSVRFCDACQGGEAYGKTATPFPFPAFLASAPSRYLVFREQATPAAAERQERSDRVSEEASFHRHVYFALTPLSYIFPCHMKHFPDNRTHANILSQYT